MLKANKGSKKARLRFERTIQSASSQENISTYMDRFTIRLVGRTERLAEHNRLSM